MKKILALLFVGAMLASCGSSYTTDKDEALELKKEQTEKLKSYFEEKLEIETDFAADEKEILADYGGKEENLIKKASAKDEDALDALADLRELELDRSVDLRELELEDLDFNNALRRSISDILNINEEKDIKSWNKAIEAEEEIQQDLEESYNKKVRKLRKD